ncbi:MAG: hypothetical protein OEL84_02115 [Nitrosopumilus sp.]|nr:hypothetical protein [Nitrosopumilus sp.]
MLDKDWIDVTKSDVDTLVYNVVQIYSDHKGKETNSTADTKKYLKMFLRWVRFGSKDFKEVGDLPETKDVKIRLVSDKLVRENLIEKSDYDRILYACHNSRDRAMFAVQAEDETQIPGWLRKNAGWWSQGLLSDEEFAQSIQYLIVNGMIRI